MPFCSHCGQKVEIPGHLCKECLETSSQSTTSFVPVGQPQAAPATVHTPDEDISLIVVKGPQVGERFFLDGKRITIGRDPKVQLFLSDVTVSREHAIITREGAEVRVRDAGSLNGTYLNGRIVEDALLNDGDILQIGTFQLRFCWGSGSC